MEKDWISHIAFGAASFSVHSYPVHPVCSSSNLSLPFFNNLSASPFDQHLSSSPQKSFQHSRTLFYLLTEIHLHNQDKYTGRGHTCAVGMSFFFNAMLSGRSLESDLSMLAGCDMVIFSQVLTSQYRTCTRFPSDLKRMVRLRLAPR